MTLSEILHRTAREFGVAPDDLKSPCRTQDLCRARYAFILAARFRKASLAAIGRHVNRDHTSARHGRDRAVHLAQHDEEWREKLERIIHGTPIVFHRHGSLGGH